MIRHILFDLDDTLLDFTSAERVALSKTLRHIGVEPTEAVLSRYHALNAAQWRLLEQRVLTRDEVKTRRYQLLFEELGVDRSPAEMTRYYESRLADEHRFIDGAPELLEQLRGRYHLYIVTNGTEHVQESRIRLAGLAAYMDGVFISQRVGADKPQRAFFEYCFARIPDFRREETLIVGDSLTSDIRGGRDAGITTVWFHPRGEENETPILPDYEIRQLSALLPLLRRLNEEKNGE